MYGLGLGPDGSVYVTQSNGLFALSSTGAVKWTYKDTCVSALAVDGNGTVYYSDAYSLVAVKNTGALAWSYSIPAGFVAAPIVGALAFGESLAFISLLIPAWGALVGIGALIGASDIKFWPVWLAGGIVRHRPKARTPRAHVHA